MKKKLLLLPGVLALVILAMSIPVLIISGTVSAFARSADLYRYGFARYNTSVSTGIGSGQLDVVAQSMADFLDGRQPSPQVTVTLKGLDRQLYSQKELVHLDDVRSIISIFKVLQIVALLSFLVSGAVVFALLGIRRLLHGVLAGAIATVSVMVLLVVWSLIDFGSLFYLFHIVSFSNQLWLLDPSRDYLIMMFTESFFYDAAIMVIATIMAEAVILGLVALVIGKTMLGRPGLAGR